MPASNILKFMTSIMSRAALAERLGQQFGGKRKLYDVLGYTKNIQYTDYLARYRRQDLAKRIIDFPAAATWETPPRIEGLDTFDDDQRRLNLFSMLERADRIAGIGRYSVILIGRAGDRLPEKPMAPVTSPNDILFLSAYSEGNATVKKVVTEPADPRFGLPEKYGIRLSADLTGVQTDSQEVEVHHSRVIHVAEKLLEDDVFGTPRLEAVYNLLDDLIKVVGGSAEMFWRSADRGFQFDVDKDMVMDKDDEKNLTDEIEEYIHEYKRYIRTRGIKITPLGADTINPKESFSAIISLISGATNIPQRLLTGSERGELASMTDERNWNRRVSERQSNFAEPVLLRPVLNILYPGAEYDIVWPDVTTLGEPERADVIAKLAKAVKDYGSIEGEPLIPADVMLEKL